ncbi:PcfJ domain-containing protein [Rhizobium sp. BK176]|uniref:PcfJ domain-containing protein n=1 Tax=Rhizobium sp. BK176 TaxID=2587071 RepID=UPI002168E4F0|nr:PcfJ domain-containing protein [Rhizobium sp. BK176]MCS4088445.1 hypothetical protein [Rhizobium sp. BK176]
MTDNVQIETWMRHEASRAKARTGVDVFDLLMASFGRVVAKELKRLGGSDLGRDLEIDSFGRYIDHIIDWLVAAKMRNEEWLSRVDSEGRPKKLMKLGTVPQMVAEANKAMRKRLNDGADLASSEGAELVHDCGGGYGIFKLTSASALDHEGFEMGHCVGQGAYDQGVADGRLAIFSVRDRFGKSHVTVEVDLLRQEVNQIKGKQNELPKAEYMRLLIGWLDPAWSIGKEDLPFGFAVDRTRRLVDLTALKPGDVFDGDLSFRSSDCEPDEYHVPIAEGVVVKGWLTVTGPDPLERLRAGRGGSHGVLQRVVLPRGLNATGGLDLRFLRLHEEKLAIEGGLNLSNCEVTKLPERVTSNACAFRRTFFDGVGGCTFGSTVTFYDCNHAKLDGVVFERSVTVRDCTKNCVDHRGAVTFGDGTVFRSILEVRDSEIGFEGTITCGNLVRFRYCHEVYMPDAMTVDGDFYAIESQIDRMPPEFEVTGQYVDEGSVIAAEQANTAPTRKFG